MVYSICPEIFSFLRYTLPSNGVAPFSTVLFFTTIVLLGLLKTLVHGRVQLWLTDRGMQDKYCTILLTLGTCNNWAGHATLCWSTSCGRQCVSMSAAAASPWDRECNTYGTCGSRSPTYCADTNRWRCHNYSCVMKAEWSVYDIMQGLRLSQQTVFEVLRDIHLHPKHCSRSSYIRVFRRSSSTNAILQVAPTSTRYGWALFTQILWADDMFYAWGFV